MHYKYYVIPFLLIITSCGSSTQERVSANKGVARDIPISRDTNIKTASNSNKDEDIFNPAIRNLPQNIASFIPKGFSAIDTTSGDLNLDDYPDMILVLKNNLEDSTINSDDDKQQKRPLYILIGQADNTYKLVRKNDNAIECKGCGGVGGDPFTGITIKNGYFSLEHGISGGQHWENIITFKYDKAKADWFLYKDGFISYKYNESNDPDAEALIKDVEKIRTVKDFGIIPFESYDIFKEKKE